jgi:hypothetical protein
LRNYKIPKQIFFRPDKAGHPFCLYSPRTPKLMIPLHESGSFYGCTPPQHKHADNQRQCPTGDIGRLPTVRAAMATLRTAKLLPTYKSKTPTANGRRFALIGGP